MLNQVNFQIEHVNRYASLEMKFKSKILLFYRLFQHRGRLLRIALGKHLRTPRNQNAEQKFYEFSSLRTKKTTFLLK